MPFDCCLSIHKTNRYWVKEIIILVVVFVVLGLNFGIPVSICQNYPNTNYYFGSFIWFATAYAVLTLFVLYINILHILATVSYMKHSKYATKELAIQFVVLAFSDVISLTINSAIATILNYLLAFNIISDTSTEYRALLISKDITFFIGAWVQCVCSLLIVKRLVQIVKQY